MTSIAQAVARFKNNPQEHLDHRLMLEACAAKRIRCQEPYSHAYIDGLNTA